MGFLIETNLTGIFNITKPAVKIMVKNKFGRIINISSVSGLMVIQDKLIILRQKLE